MFIRKRGQRSGRTILIMTMMGIMGVSTVSFSFKYYNSSPAANVEKLRRSILHIQAALKVDNVRHYKIQKILSIINKYNNQLPLQEKIDIANVIYEMAVKYSNLDVDLICATITHESALSWNPEVVSFAGAMGLMQIMPNTAKRLCRQEGIRWTSAEEILFNPIVNVRLGCRYLSTLIQAYDIDGGLAAYNGGERRAELWIKNNKNDEILWEETRGYIPAVLKLYKRFQQNTGIL